MRLGRWCWRLGKRSDLASNKYFKNLSERSTFRRQSFTQINLISMTHQTPRFSLALILGALLASSASAATTIAHWTDFSTTTVEDVANDYNLTRQGATADWYSGADNAVFTPASKTLSLEVVFEASFLNTTNGKFLAAHFNSGSSNRSYALALTSANQVQVVVSSNGTGSGAGYSASVTDFTILTGVQYYVGATVDLSSSTQAERTVTVYLMNLTTPESPLQSQTFDNISPSIFYNPNAPFTVGAQGDGSGGNKEHITAVFDEVRLTDGVLGSHELLVAIPEPSSVGLLVGGLSLGLVVLRRRRQ